jgi:hypothetical protein
MNTVSVNEEGLAENAGRQMLVVFDLDGTLANSDHRVKFLQREPKDWRGFYAACDLDTPCHPLILTLKALCLTDADVQIWSGRSKEVEDKTRSWLARHGLGDVPLRMREVGDHRPDTTIKEEWLTQIGSPWLVFEDRASVVDMWRSHGIVCAQVAPGDF